MGVHAHVGSCPPLPLSSCPAADRAFALLGVLCGLVGAAFVHTVACLVRMVRRLRRLIETPTRDEHMLGREMGGAMSRVTWLRAVMRAPTPTRLLALRVALSRRALMLLLLSRYGYTLMVALTSSMLTYPFRFFRSSPEEIINTLFGALPFELTDRWSNPSLLVNLGIFLVCKFAFTVTAVGCPIACGVFSPVFLLGAAFGRFFGEVRSHHILSHLPASMTFHEPP